MLCRAGSESVTVKKVITMHQSTPLAVPNKAPSCRSNSFNRTRSIKSATTRKPSQIASDVAT